jgi:hypothetical protein
MKNKAKNDGYAQDPMPKEQRTLGPAPPLNIFVFDYKGQMHPTAYKNSLKTLALES